MAWSDGQPTSGSAENEYFIGAHIYTRSGILAHVLFTLWAIAAEVFPSFW
jgi:hypothetical protein